MARPLRIEVAGGLYHITSRGDRHEHIYVDDADRLAWLEVFSKVCRHFNWVCHAWCQMTNHYHIVVETLECNLSKGMRQLNGVYTQFANRRHRKVGHVFQGRFKAILVERESYLLELARYVVLNPVRAGLVGDAGQWRWSSYASMVGIESSPPWLQTDWILSQFGPDRPRAVARYVDFVHTGSGLPSVWENLQGQVLLGSPLFVKAIIARVAAGADLEIPLVQRRPVAEPLAHYVERYENVEEGMALAVRTGNYTLAKIASAFGVHYSTVSRAAKQWESSLHPAGVDAGRGDRS